MGTEASGEELPPALRALARPAAVAEIGGLRPPERLDASWASRVTLGLPGEAWPAAGGEPMLALAQIVVAELPVVPEPLAGIALLTLFVGPRELPIDEPNGTGWCLRLYDDLGALVPLAEPPSDAPRPRPFPLRWHAATDWPGREDVPDDLLDAWDEHVDAGERYSPLDGLKAGGWPMTVQGAVDWREDGSWLDDVEFVLQVDSDDKTGFSVGFAGALYVGRSRGAGTWHLAWQSM